MRLTREKLGWPAEPPFLIPEEALRHFRQALAKGKEAEASWDTMLSAYAREFPEHAQELSEVMEGILPAGWDAAIPAFPADPKGMASRVASGKVLNAVAPRLPMLIGGSADLNPSTNTALQGLGDFESPALDPADRQGTVGPEWGYGGRNIHFGVREHAMASIMNGMAAHGGTIPFGATFLTFSDYLRPALRLAALMGLKVIHVFTHDSIALGEDGPTHQPIEQIGGAQGDPEPAGDPSRRRQRDRRRLAGGAGSEEPPGGARPLPPESAHPRPEPLRPGRGAPARGLYPGRCGRGISGAAPYRHRLGALAGTGGAGGAPGGKNPCQGRLHA